AAPKKKKPKEWWKQGQPRFAKSDLGRVFSGTIDLQNSRRPATLKALAIRVGEPLEAGTSATVLFDTELLRASGAVPDHFVAFNTYRDGLGGSGHRLGPPYVFTTRREPGWAKDGKFDDPRSKPNGPLPRDWAKYRGLYRHGPRTVLSYTVGKTSVLESPWIEAAGDVRAVSRTLEIGAAKVPLLLKVCDVDGLKGEVQTADGRSWLLLEKDEQLTAVGIVSDRGGDKIKLATADKGRVVVEVSP
ncbi:unnamed protein product, partial [marine sediment metagenome]